jgi:prepilin-type N-terminal cleavage/methylation domain-containing protein
MNGRQRGFTLVEIAVVLVIIGLLLGGVLKGQELINSAKVKNLAQDFRTIPLFIYGYQDKFRALPGDDANAVAHLCSDTTAGAGTACTANGNGDGMIAGHWYDTQSSEAFYFWQHVRLANLASGSTSVTDANYLPRNAEGGLIGVQSGRDAPFGLRGTYVMCSAGILGKYVKQLDVTMDDGDPATGAMRAGTAASPDDPAPTRATRIDDATTYTVCLAF